MEQPIKHPGEFFHESKLLGLRTLRADHTSYGGFKNPVEVGAVVSAPDWSEEPCCGKGLHFIPWGLGHEDRDHGVGRPVFQVVEPVGKAVVVADGIKCKAESLRIVHTGTLSECMNILLPGLTAFSTERAIGQERSTGDSSSAASTGYSSSAASTGYSSSAASTGDSSSAASTGDSSSAASTGDSSSAASTGDSSSAASTGDRSSAASTGDVTASTSTGLYSKARAGKFGCLALAWWNDIDCRAEMRCREIGCGDGSDGKLKADTWYQLDEAGSFVEVNESV